MHHRNGNIKDKAKVSTLKDKQLSSLRDVNHFQTNWLSLSPNNVTWFTVRDSVTARCNVIKRIKCLHSTSPWYVHALWSSCISGRYFLLLPGIRITCWLNHFCTSIRIILWQDLLTVWNNKWVYETDGRTERRTQMISLKSNPCFQSE